MIKTIKIGMLTFKLVSFEQLTYQKQYIIQIVDFIHECYVAGRFLEKVLPRENSNPSGARFFIRDIFGEKRGLRTFYEQAFYFELLSKRDEIQQNMENRALIQILRKVIGDPSFTIG